MHQPAPAASHPELPEQGGSVAPQYAATQYDRASIWFFLIIGVGCVVAAVIAAVVRLREVFSGGEVPVPALFADTMVQAPIGPGGALVEVRLEEATVFAPALPIASTGAAVLEALSLVLGVTVIVVSLLFVARNVLRGVIFSRSQTRAVSTAAVASLATVALVPFFGNMVANGAVAWISEREFLDTVVMSIEPIPYLLGAFVASIVITAFTVGDRLRRETEGLV